MENYVNWLSPKGCRVDGEHASGLLQHVGRPDL